MKKVLSIVALFLAFSILSPEASGQVKINLKKKLNKQADNRANKNTDEAIEKSFDKMEEGIKGIFKKKDPKTKSKDKETENASNQTSPDKSGPDANTPAAGKTSPALSWAKYDFVPGDKIIFEDNLMFEENGEFPSRWDLVNGNVEIAEFGGENVIMFMSGNSCIIPFLKNPERDYLPDIFTIEFDAYYDVEPHSAKYFVALYDKKNQKGAGISLQNIQLYPGGIQFTESSNLISGGDGLWYNRKKPFWRHVSIGFNIRSLKVYYDDVRMLNIPNLGFNPTGMSVSIINTDPVNFYIKNIRISEGGQKLYDKFLQDGKIISNGIRFDVNKATLRPESMGVLNEIYKMLSEHSGVAISIEGHTDSDGDNDLNQKLSEERAETVRKQLVSMGLSADRLTSKGFGESVPVNTNATPEGKAENRRVEFVKKSGTNSQSASASIISQPKGNNQSSGNTADYQSVTIGNQEWMQKNLDVDSFRNGEPIPQAKTAEEWQNLRYEKKAAWCYWNFISASGNALGKLYNWYAINDPRSLAPEGWRIPGDGDWDLLRKKLVIGVAGDKMKSKTGWKGANGTNSSGFNGKATGYFDYDGNFENAGAEGYWWSSTNDGTPWSSSIYLSAEDKYMHKHQMSKGSGLSVRCIK